MRGGRAVERLREVVRAELFLKRLRRPLGSLTANPHFVLASATFNTPQDRTWQFSIPLFSGLPSYDQLLLIFFDEFHVLDALSRHRARLLLFGLSRAGSVDQRRLYVGRRRRHRGGTVGSGSGSGGSGG